MATSGLCGKRNCVTRVGSSGEIVELEIPQALDIGEFNLNSLASLSSGIVSSSGDNDPITVVIRDYGSEPFYSSVAAVNQFFARPDARDLIDPEVHPLLTERVNSGIIFTPVEIAEFIRDFGYTPLSLSATSSIITIRLVNEFEAFYTKNFTQSTIGSFCALVPGIFGAIGGFFTALQDIAKFVNKLKNFALNFSLSSLINQLKNGITKVIDKVISKVKSIIENFSLENIISEVKTFLVEKIGGQFQKIKEAALKFFDPENLKNFKAKIEAIIDYAVGVFKNPTLEDIQFLILRFCQFAAQVENGINAIKNPLETFANSYKDTLRILKSNSASNTSRSVTAGGIRYDLPARGTGINTSREIYTAAGDIPPLGPEEFREITPWNEGKGDSRVTFNGRWVAALGRDGWEKVDVRARAMLMKVQKDFGRSLFVNSGYRSPEYNAGLKGAAKNSYHMQGMALDISWSGIDASSREEFVRLARVHGFRGIGRYGPANGNFVHIDIGPERSWSKGI
jgi:hypothetical protein